MGVPKFYRWISERYPCLSEVVREYQIPEFDNLYLDMNGIIHNCSHPNDDDVHFRITEEKIFADIFHYIEVLFRLIRPQKVFLMAIDGVAPRAKMNQQRGRRFRSAQEAARQEAEAKKKGEALPDEERFDSNCITPGTEFMVKLQEQLKFFVAKKVSTDPLWQGCQMILSGHETPGEGEHKIMEYIRYQKSQPGYNANTRHCLYGLDADLMMLGLCTHEPHFSLLREEVRFGGKASQQRVTAPEETTFHLLHLSLMREYLDYEFSDLKGKTPFDYDIEHIIDDWILMGFLVGNDFIPNLPHFHIAKGALPILYRTYIAVLPTLDGYINENGKLNMKRFEAFMAKLSEIDIDYFQDIHENNKFLLSKRSKAKQDNPSFEPVVPKSKEVSKFLKQQALELRELGLDSESDSEGTDSGQDIFNREFIQHKQAYYKEKLDGDASVAYLKDQAESYVRAIQWNLFYYYNGVASWSWYFPHHYAPFVSDITGFADLNLKFDLSKPFLPYEQLLGVLPAASKKLLPEAFQGLMTSQESPIIDFYPTDFETDLNGKQQEWEAVVLIPLIDERRLIKAMAECESYLTDEEKKRNTHGPMYSFVYTPDDLGRLDAPGYFSPIMHNYAKCSLFTRDDLAIEESKILRGLCPGVRLDLYFQGFPTLKHIQHKFYLKEAKVKVFQQPSMGWNMILELTEDQGEFDLEALAKELVGKCVFVEWPHLVEAKVEALANEENHYSLLKDSKVLKRTPMSQDLRQVWNMQASTASERYQNRFGIKIGHTNVLVYAKTLTGRTYTVTNDGRVTLEKSWAKDTSPHPLQTIVRDVNIAEVGPPKYQTLEELYPVTSMCFILTEQYYGAPAEIIEHLTDKDKGKLRVCIEEHPVPSFEKGGVEEDYAAGFVLARDLHISGHLISRITGTIFITSKENKKYNVGLNLKFNKKNEEVLGWTKRVEGEWRYSYKTQDTLREMMQKFPDFFKYIGDHTGDDNYNEADVFPGQNSSQRLKELTTWIAAAPCQKAERQTCGMPCLGSSAVAAVEAGVRQANSKGAVKKFFSKVKPKGLYKPSSYQGSALPDPTTEFQLLDRIINVRDAFCVPQGYLGTIIGIRNWDKNIRDVVLEVVFDQDFPDGMVLRGCSAGKGYLMPSYTLINLSHGERVFKKIGSGAGKESDSVPTGMKMPALTATQTVRGANQAYGSVPPPSGIYQRSPYQNARQGQTQGSGSRNDELFNPASPRNNNAGRSRDRPPGKEVRRENKPAPEKEFRAPNFQAPMPRPTTVSLTEAAKKLPSPMNFVRGETLVGTTEKPIDDLSKAVFNALRLGSASAEPKSITFEDLASGTRPPVVKQQTAEVKEQFNPAVQSFLDSAPAANMQLLDMSMRMGMGTPRYDYRPVGNGFQAIVRMPNGQVFEGKAMPNREKASESAARIALTASQQHSPVGYYPFPPQVLASQMNSLPGVLQMRFPSNAFPGQPPFMGFPLGPAPPPPAFAHSQPFQSHRPRTNPGFVPPQVQRQAAGPSKKADEREKKESEVSKSVTPQQATSVRPNSNQRQRPAQTQSREATRREPRKAKLAAKFSNPPT